MKRQRVEGVDDPLPGDALDAYAAIEAFLNTSAYNLSNTGMRPTEDKS
jgi:hypothetical protein